MPAHAGIHGDQAKPAETLDARVRGDDSQRGRPNGGEGAAVTRAPTTVPDEIQPRYGFRSLGWIVSCMGGGFRPRFRTGYRPMTRAELTEKILDKKREKGWTWKHIADEIGGMSPVLVIGALLGQMKLPKPLAEKAASLFGLSEPEKRMLNEVPTRGTPMPPTDPLLYRFYRW
jgi:hypothetical protein